MVWAWFLTESIKALLRSGSVFCFRLSSWIWFLNCWFCSRTSCSFFWKFCLIIAFPRALSNFRGASIWPVPKVSLPFAAILAWAARSKPTCSRTSVWWKISSNEDSALLPLCRSRFITKTSLLTEVESEPVSAADLASDAPSAVLNCLLLWRAMWWALSKEATKFSAAFLMRDSEVEAAICWAADLTWEYAWLLCSAVALDLVPVAVSIRFWAVVVFSPASSPANSPTAEPAELIAFNIEFFLAAEGSLAVAFWTDAFGFRGSCCPPGLFADPSASPEAAPTLTPAPVLKLRFWLVVRPEEPVEDCT